VDLVRGSRRLDASQLAGPKQLKNWEQSSGARMASDYTGKSMSECVSRIVAERGMEDAERLHKEVTREIAQNAQRKAR
jgi:hypothetical protein